MRIGDISSSLLSVTSVPQAELSQMLLNAVQCSNASIKTTFFSQLPSSDYPSGPILQQAALQEFAVKYLTYVISICTTRSFDSTVCNISYQNIQEWFQDYGSTVGLGMMFDYVFGHTNSPSPLTDSAKSLAVMVKRGKDLTFINGFAIQCNTAGSYIPAKLFLNLFHLLDPGGQAIQNVLPAWQASECWSLVQDYRDTNWLETAAQLFVQDTDAFNTVKNAVDQAIAIRTGPYPYKVEVPVVMGMAGPPVSSEIDSERYEYGESVVNWLNGPDGPAKYGMRSKRLPNNFEDKDAGSSGCVREDTPIRMADGGWKVIQDIVPGDLVMNSYGMFSVCSTEKIYNPYVQEMYGINEEPVFLSPEHALMTNRGWCSLNPFLSRRLNPQLSVNRLEVGDQVWRFQSFERSELAIEKVLVTQINIERAAGECFIGYDLHFSEGYHSYFARDYLCLLNYPEITIANVLLNIKNKMSAVEEIKFLSLLRENEGLFRKIFGHEVINQLSYQIANTGGKI